jgi:hypothetical protein
VLSVSSVFTVAFTLPGPRMPHGSRRIVRY